MKMKKRNKLQWLAFMLAAALMITFATPAVSARAMLDQVDPDEGISVNVDFYGGSISGMYGAGGLNFSSKATMHMENSARYVPVQILQEAINVGIPTLDTRGSSATMYTTPMYRNGSLYNLEVLYHKDTNTVYHFMYTK